jgi:atypical dual specificity phosphatase
MVHIADNLYIDAAPDFGAGPGTEARILEWLRQGVAVVVSLREFEFLEAAYRALGLEFRHIPVPDFGVPGRQDVADFLGAVAENRGRKVLAHCIAGRGRSGTMAALYLRSRGMDGAEAVRRVRELRPGAIETAEQEDLVLNYRFEER